MLGPAFQHPLELGADMVLYSATKYLSGFSDLIGGVALASDPALIQKCAPCAACSATFLQPDECWMLDNRLPTVGLRMNRAKQERAAHRGAAGAAIRRSRRSCIRRCSTIRNRSASSTPQCDFPGAMFSLDLRGGKPAAFEFLRNLRLARNAVSLGGVETLVCHPKTTTHSGFTEEQFAEAGVTDGLVRVSIGIEDWRDLLADFEQALEAA